MLPEASTRCNLYSTCVKKRAYSTMRLLGIDFVSLLRACGDQRDLCKGFRLHADILKLGLLEDDCYVASALVSMYARCGALANAQQVLDELPARNIVSWSALIAGYVQHEQGEVALKCFEYMQCEGLPPDAITFASIFKACAIIGAADKGEELHAEIVQHRLLEKDCVLGNALVDMYAKCGALAKAQLVLDELPRRTVIAWSSLIVGHAQHGHAKEALECFKQMQCEGTSPDAVTFICILKAIGSIQDAELGEKIHGEIVRQGLLRKKSALCNALVDMYAKCGALAKAEQVVHEFPSQDVISWNVLIAGYASYGRCEEALNSFELMQNKGLSPNIVTLVCILKVCGTSGEIDKGEKIHGDIVRKRFFRKSIALGDALVDMYAKCGALLKAQKVHDDLCIRTVVAWSALIGGYALHGFGVEALDCFEQMHHEGSPADIVTFVSVIRACGSIGAIDEGEKIHAEVGRQGLLEENISLRNALVDMYAKCGALVKAREVMDEHPTIVSWNAVIAGYAKHGCGEDVLSCFKGMLHRGLSPDAATLASVLSACSHSGFLDEAEMHFSSMQNKYGIVPDLEHHTCMVDLFARAGHFDKAVALINKLPYLDCLSVWDAVIGACRKWGNVKLGKSAFEHLKQMDGNYAAPYISMSSIYTALGMQEDVEAMRVYEKGRRWV